MIALRLWSFSAGAVLLISMVVHGSTFLGNDPMEVIPGVMWITLLIFPLFIAALAYVTKIGAARHIKIDKVIAYCPLWLRVMTGMFFVYALVNFAIVGVLSEGGGPHKRAGRFVLQSHGRIIRELTEEEYHQHRAYVVRGFSGHWMLFSSGSLMAFVAVLRLRKGQKGSIREEPEAAQPTTMQADLKPLPPQATTGVAAFLAMIVYVGCVAMILSGRPALGTVSAIPVALSAVFAFRRRFGLLRNQRFESVIGCLTVFPNAFLASWMGGLAARFIYLCIYVGLHAAVTHSVTLCFPKAGPAQLSNGVPLDNHVWSALELFIQFPLFVIGTIGLVYMAECVGRFVEGHKQSR